MALTQLNRTTQLNAITKGLNKELDDIRQAHEADKSFTLKDICRDISGKGRYSNFVIRDTAFGDYGAVNNKANTSFTETNDTNKVVIHNDRRGSVSITENDLDDDELGAVHGYAQDAHAAYLDVLESDIASILTNGESEVVSGTENLLSSSGDNANIVSGTGTSDAQLAADLDTAWATFSRFTDSSGRQLNMPASDLVIVCPPEIYLALMRVVESHTLTPQQFRKNPLVAVYQAKILSTPKLTDTNDFYVCIANQRIKPLALINRQKLRIQSNHVMDVNLKYWWIASARYAVTSARKQALIKITNS